MMVSLMLVAAIDGGHALAQCVPPSVVGQPQGAEYCLGRPPTEFTVAAVGTEPLRYQWRRDGTDIAGANGPMYTDPRPGLFGRFDCVVSNACGSVTSERTFYTSNGCVAESWNCNDFGGCGCGVVGQGSDGILYYLYEFIEGHIEADCDDGTFTGTPDGGVTIDDLVYWLFRYEIGC